MKVIAYDPKEVDDNPAINARQGDPDPDQVERLALNMLERHEAGREPQMQPGVVRVTEKGKVQVIAGRHRLAAIRFLNLNLPKDTPKDEYFKFNAIVARAEDDIEALLDSLDENEFRVAPTVFDRSDVVARLLAGGKTPVQIAKRLQITEGYVSQLKGLKDTPKKYRKMVEDGDMRPEALITLMSIPVKDNLDRQELVELALDYRRKEDEIAERIEKRQAAKAEADQDAADEAAAKKDGDKEENGKKGKKKTKAVAKKAVKKNRTGKKGQVRTEDVKRAAADRGNIGNPGAISKVRFIAIMEALGEDKEAPLPESARMLLGRIEAVLDGEATPKQFYNALIKHCVPDAKAQKAA